MASNEDLLFVELALKRELVTQDQADEILALRDKLGEMGLAESVADLMVKKGVLSESDAESVRAKVSPKGGRQQIKGYRLLERLGRGGMGSVYKAVQLSMERTVALKVLKPSLVEDDQSTSRLRREAQLVGQLRHPNIVQGLDFGVSHGFHYFAMEYVDGESVRQILERDGPMKEADAIRIVTDVAKALEHAHQEGIVHRDVKPGNILVGRDGTGMLADYGLAKGPLEDAELTRSGVTVGTPQYISPEQAQGPKDVDIRTDVYSLGATLYHMLTGRPPYEGETLAHLIQQVLYEEYAPVRAIRRDISPDVAYLVAKMMARKPAHRYQNPKALLKDLQAIEEGRSIIPAGWEGSIEALAGRRRTRVLMVIIALLLFLGIGGAVAGKRHVEKIERQKAEESAAEFIGKWLDEARPENYETTIKALEKLFADPEFGWTEAVREHRDELAELKRQNGYVEKGNDLQMGAGDCVRDGSRYADALRQIRLFLEKYGADRAEGEGADWARERALELRDRIELMRDRFVEENFRRKKKDLRSRKPEEARDALRDVIDGLRSQAYVADEKPEGLDSAEQLFDDLVFSTRRVGEYLAEAEVALADDEYGKANSLLTQDRKLYENDTPLNEALRRLEPEWQSDLDRRFPDLERKIAEANQAEWADISEQARVLFEEQKAFRDATELLTGLGERSIPDIEEQIRGMTEELAETLAGLRNTAGTEWDRFLPVFLDFLGNRSWAAAETELTNLEPMLLTHEPNDWKDAWRGARETLDFARGLELGALAALDGRKSVTLTFGTIRETMYDLRVDNAERSITWSREPGGPRQESWIRNLSVEDLVREAGQADADPQGRFVQALLRLGEIRGMSDLAAAARELDLIESWIGEARKYQLLGNFPSEVLGYVREFEKSLRVRLLSDERRAEAIFEEAEAARKSERWQEAYDKYSLLLEEKKLRDTKFVRDREPSIRTWIKDIEQKLPGARVGEHLRAKVRHVSGNSIKRSHYRIVATWDFRNRDGLERWRFTEGRVGLVETMVHVSGPELAETVRRQSLLGFLPPENGAADWLQNHPLRMESPLLYSRDMSISFRVRWKEPLALVVSLCGTNLVVLSDDGRKENGRGVHIWQSEDLTRPARAVPDVLRRTYIETHPNVLKGDAANRRYFQFEANRWYRVRFEKRDRSAALYVSDRLVYERDIKPRGAKGRDIVLLTWTPCEIDDLELRGTVDPAWYHRHVK